jgi:predicted GNAT family N-acyltransferase
MIVELIMNQLLVRSESAEDVINDLALHKSILLSLDIWTQQNEFAELANRKLAAESKCEFGIVSSKADWDGIRQLRLKMYHGKRVYLGSLVDHDGNDEYDNHSYLFYAKQNGKYLASVRFTEYPFETSQYFKMNELETFLGQDYEQNYLEIGRLVADSSAKVAKLSQAILVFGMAMTLSLQNKTRYLAYSHPRLKRKAFRYNQEEQTQAFYIPERRGSEYMLFKGCMKQEIAAVNDFIN